MGIYELNRVELLRDVFVWAYDDQPSAMWQCDNRWRT
jgi:hypothetical protein